MVEFRERTTDQYELAMGCAFAEDACADALEAVRKLQAPYSVRAINDAIQMLNNAASSLSDAARELSEL